MCACACKREREQSKKCVACNEEKSVFPLSFKRKGDAAEDLRVTTAPNAPSLSLFLSLTLSPRSPPARGRDFCCSGVAAIPRPRFSPRRTGHRRSIFAPGARKPATTTTTSVRPRPKRRREKSKTEKNSFSARIFESAALPVASLTRSDARFSAKKLFLRKKINKHKLKKKSTATKTLFFSK